MRQFGAVRAYRKGWRIYVHPVDPKYLYGLRGAGFATRQEADGVLTKIRERVERGEDPERVVYELRSAATADAPRREQAPWKEDYKGRMLRAARTRAEKRSIPFEITADDLYVPDKCPVLGIRLAPSNPGDGRQDSAPSLDRINNAKGYVPGNVVVISWRANRLKSTATAGELRKIADWLAYCEHIEE